MNYSDELTKEDENLFDAVKDMEVIVIVNKTDLPQKIDLERVRQLAQNHKLITTFLIEEKGIEELEEAIADLFFSGSIEANDMTYVSNSRHIGLLTQALNSMKEVRNGIEIGIPIDIIQIDLTRSWELLGEITGDSVQDELINQLFSQFCLGK